MKVLIIILIHISGAILAIIFHYKDGTFEWASKNGDGIRFSTPCDIVFDDVFLWEIEFLLFIIEQVEMKINNFFDRSLWSRNDE